MRLRFHDDVGDFAAAAGEVYRRDPTRHTVELTLLRGGPLPGTAPLLVTVWDGLRVSGAALRTPPYPLLCSGLSPATVDCVVDGLAAAHISLSGVRGPRRTALAFSRRWQAVTGASALIGMNERLYRLAALRAPSGVAGMESIAGEADSSLVLEWQCQFAVEALGNDPDPHGARAALAAGTAAGDAHVIWTVDGEPTSMAGVRAPAAGVSRIGPVYTPERHRGRGYGSAVTAAACRWAAAAGAIDVVLFADLANPVSNSIYRRIGFQPVADWVHAAFAV